MTTEPNNALARLEATGVTVLTGDYRGWTNRIKIAGTTGNEYTVSMRTSSGEWGCSCPGWIFSRRCSHLETMLPTLLEAFPGSTASKPLERRAARTALPTPPEPQLPPPPPGETHQERIRRIVTWATTTSAAIPQAPLPDRPRTVAEDKRRERIRQITSGEIYKKVAPGTANDWARMASAFTTGDATFQADARAYRPTPASRRASQSPILATLGLDAMPDDATTLRSAYRRAVMGAFQAASYVDTDPRYVASFARITTAYEALKKVRGW